jgi:microcystin-dependent protein
MWTTNSAPTDWLICDGAAVSRTTYATLFALVGTTYGTGNGSTTFNLPNLKGSVAVGRDSGQTEFDALGETGGAKSVTLTSAQSGVPAHSHGASSGIESANHVHYTYNSGYFSSGLGGGGSPVPYYESYVATSGVSQNHTHSITVNNNTAADASSAHTNLQPYVVLNYIIKAQ